MVNTNHRELSGAALHEPKGVASATIGQVYVADGAGSGDWSNNNVPTGGFIYWSTSSVPTGYLHCNGASKSTTTFATLFGVIGYTYGGSGANFNLPDLRGEFIRCFNNGTSRDPDKASRTDRGDGTTGDEVGTKQGWALVAHTHGYRKPGVDELASAGTNLNVNRVASNSQPSDAHSAASSIENRPRNIQLMMLIKT